MNVPLATSSSSTFSYASTILRYIEYGPGSLSKLPTILDKLQIKVPLIITGNSLNTKTNVIKDISATIKASGRELAGVHSSIGEHAPIKGIREGMDMLSKHSQSGQVGLIAVGGGSPIDSAKAIIKFYEEKHGETLKMISIPTTLSAAEFTMIAGYTDENQKKTVFRGRDYTSSAIIYDANLALATPNKLWISTGIRALDHAVEQQLRPGASLPVKALAREAFSTLAEALRACAKDEKDVQARQRAFNGASMSLWSDDNMGSIGLSHSLGYLLGAPYHMPHGYCSCITLGPVVSALAQSLSSSELKSLASLLPAINPSSSASTDEEKVLALGAAVDQLVEETGVQVRLSDYKVPESDLDEIVQKGLKSVGREKDGNLAADLLKRLKGKM